MVRSSFVSRRQKNIIGAPAPHPPTQIYLFAVDSVKIHNDFWDYLSSEMSCRVWQNEACRLEYECLENLIFGSWYVEYWIQTKPEICKCQSLLRGVVWDVGLKHKIRKKENILSQQSWRHLKDSIPNVLDFSPGLLNLIKVVICFTEGKISFIVYPGWLKTIYQQNVGKK